MNISKKSLHYKWIRWLYGLWDIDPAKNVCPYFWQFVCSIIVAPFTLMVFVIGSSLSFAIALISWILGSRPILKAPKTKHSEGRGCRPIFLCEPCDGAYKSGLYTKDPHTNSRIAPWEVLVVLWIIYGLVVSTKTTCIVLVCVGAFLFLFYSLIKNWDVFSEYLDSVKKKHCKKITFVD